MDAERDSAWRHKELVDFITRLPLHAVSALHIVAPHASGKSTTLLAKICSLIRQDGDLAQTSVLYLVATQEETRCLYDYVRSEEFESQHGITAATLPFEVGRVTFWSCREFCADNNFEALCRTGRNTLVLVDLEIAPTTYGEIALGLLLQWTNLRLDASHCGNGIITPSSFKSKRTIAAVERAGVDDCGTITVPAVVSGFSIQHVHGKWVDELGRRVHEVDAAGLASQNRFLIFTDKNLDIGTDYQRVAHNRFDLFAQALGTVLPIVLFPGFPFSTHFKNLTCVASSGYIKRDDVWDAQIAQVVTRGRWLTHEEVDREKAWVLKSGVDPQNVSFVDAQQSWHRRARGHDMPGPAYGVNLLWTVLELISRWPKTPLRKMPVRMTFDHDMVGETCRKLRLNGCIRTIGQGADCEVTDRGQRTLAFLRAYPSLGFRVAYLIGAIVDGKDRGWSSACQRVAARIASIHWVGIDRFINPQTKAMPGAHALGDHYIGISRHKAVLGGVWPALGIWQKLMADAVVVNQANSSERPAKVLEGWLYVNLTAAGSIFDKVREIESLLGLSSVDSETEEKETRDFRDGPEIVELEAELMWSHIDHMAFYKCSDNERQLSDMASTQPLQFEPGELLSPDQVCQSSGDYVTGFFATYTDLSRPRDGTYVASGVTIVPMHAIRQISARTGMSFTQSMLT